MHGLGRQLVAHLGENVRRRADEGDTGFLAGAGEISVFAQKAVAGMDGVGFAFCGHFDDTVDVQVTFVRLGRADAVSFVGIHHVP